MPDQIEQPAAADSKPEVSMDDRLMAKFYGDEQPENDVEQEQPDELAGEQAEEAPAEAAAAPAEPELAEVEFNGKQYKLPPELKDAFMAQSDYTKKTQEVAEQRKLIDLQQTTLQKQNQFRQAIGPELQQLGHLDVEIQKYTKLDWGTLDTDTLIRARTALDQLREQKLQLQTTVQGKVQEFEQGIQKLRQETVQRGTEYLKKVIPNWGEETAKDVLTWGKNKNVSDVKLENIEPVDAEAYWKAAQWDKLVSQKDATQQKVAKAPPIGKPGASQQQSVQSQRDKAYKAALASAKTSTERAKIVDQRLAQKLFG